MGYGIWRKRIFRGIEVRCRPQCEHPRAGSRKDFRCPGLNRLSMRTLFDYYAGRWVVKKIGPGKYVVIDPRMASTGQTSAQLPQY